MAVAPVIPSRVQAIIDQVCAEHDVDVGAVLGPRMFAKLVSARRVCWREIRKLRRPTGEPFSYPQIGAWFGKDHSTVILGLRALEAIEQLEAEIRPQLADNTCERIVDNVSRREYPIV